MEIKNPEYLLEIADQKNMTRAAEQLFLTQSTLSQYLLKLENELGTPLFTRKKNELIPTDAGQMAIQAAHAIVTINRQLEEGLASLKNEGYVRLGVSSLWGMQMATELLPTFKEHFPTVTLKIYESHSLQLRSMLLADKLDMAVIAIDEAKALLPLELRELRQEELVFVLPEGSPYCTVHRQDSAIARSELSGPLRNMNYVFSDEGSTVRLVEDKLFQRLMFRPNVVCELNSNTATLDMVAKGVGAAFVPRDYVQNVAGVRSFRLEPPMLRSNVLAFRKNLERTAQVQLLEELICGYPLFH